ncbi:MAG: RNA-binding cell elongation regulator Jag/EloR [Anaerolineales bacterium]|nr:RNA-binding cell elongation regulator Jag/EloR [Anaerolineales bacterium]
MSAVNDIEIRGQTVEEAIQAGLNRLGLERSDVIVDVIDEGNKGILGIGSREAVVRLVPMVTSAKPPASSAVEVDLKGKPDTAVTKKQKTPPAAKQTHPQPSQASLPTLEEIDEEREVAVEIVETLLKKMQVDATLEVVLSEPDDVTGRQINELQISGSDLGVLIGPRGDTLNSFQYITRLMVGHRLHRRADFVIDIEGYRERRRQALARLANRMADKVINRNRPVTLEPMPAYERRIIHMTLRGDRSVTTESVGAGDRRKVTIIPLKD